MERNKKEKIKTVVMLSVIIALLALCTFMGIEAITNSQKLKFGLGVGYTAPFSISVELKVNDDYVQVFDSQSGNKNIINSTYVAGVSDDVLNLEKNALTPQIDSNTGKNSIYFNLNNHETNKTMVFLIKSGIEELEIIILANESQSDVALAVGDITNGALITITATAQIIETLTLHSAIATETQDFSTVSEFQNRSEFTSIMIFENHNYGETGLYVLSENLGTRYEVIYSTTNFQSVNEFTITIKSLINSSAAPIQATISIIRYDHILLFTSPRNSVNIPSETERWYSFDRDFVLNLSATAIGGAAFSFDVYYLDENAKKINDIKINYDWKKTSTVATTGILTIPRVGGEIDDRIQGIKIEANSSSSWTGNTSNAFASGGGIESSPYIISNGAELSYLQSLGSNANISGYYKLSNNISLNDEVFIDLGNGFLKVTDGVNIGYIGTGQSDIVEGELITYSNGGKWYAYYDGTYTELEQQPAEVNGKVSYGDSGEINVWSPIGNSTYFFQGVFDGNSYTINGLYINNTSDCQGLFGVIGGLSYNTSSLAKVNNLSLNNGFISGANSVGAFCGQAGRYSYDNYINYFSIEKCNNSVVIFGTDVVGGVVGYSESPSTSFMSYCYNSATINSVNRAGGICGLAGATIKLSCNEGNISCYNSGNNIGPGGIVAGCHEGSMKRLYKCVNQGKIVGFDNSGGILSLTSGTGGETIQECVNLGEVLSLKYSAGLMTTKYRPNIIDSYNYGIIRGCEVAGGLFAFSNYQDGSSIRNSFNIGDVRGNANIGSLIGFMSSVTITNCYYLKGTAVDGSGVKQNGVGNATQGQVTLDAEQIIGVDSVEQFKDINFIQNTLGWDMSIWGLDPNINDGFPYLLDLVDFF